MKTGEIACAVPDLHDYRLYDHRTGEPLDPVEAETLLWLHLDHCRQCQNRMIHDPRNRNLKRGGNAGRGNEWARKNVACTSLPSKFRNLSHQNRVNQTEAARLLLAWRERKDIATAIDAIGWEKATYGNVQKRLSRDIDRELFTNVLNSGGHPSLPTVERTQFPYAYSNNNSCGMCVIDQPAGVIRYERMAVYDRFVDVEIYAPHIMRLHPNLTKVSRPTLRWNGDCVTWDVIVFEPKPRKEGVDKVSHVVGFDLNADWHGGISGARLSYNGTVSRELVAGIDTRRQQTVLEELYVQYQRCLKKLDRLMPWQRPHDPGDPQQVAAHPEWRRLYEQSLNLRDKMYRIKTLFGLAVRARHHRPCQTRRTHRRGETFPVRCGRTRRVPARQPTGKTGTRRLQDRTARGAGQPGAHVRHLPVVRYRQQGRQSQTIPVRRMQT